jgi:hypothetical protein
MLKRYFDFVNESLELVLESDVVYSAKFRNVLSKIDSNISKKLIEIENVDLPVRGNYFDTISSKNDMVSFIPDRKAQEILKDVKELWRFNGAGGGWLKHSESNAKLFSKLGYVPEGAPYSPNSSDLGEIVSETTSEVSGKIYCWVKFMNESEEYVGQGVYNKEKIIRTEGVKEKEVWTKSRQEISVGRGIRALLLTTGEKFLDKDIEQFVNLYKSTIDKLNDKFSFFEVVSGDDIAYWYNANNYFQRSGSLGSSCMANAKPSWLEIYTKNPEQCSMVIFKSPENNDKIVGRALLWTLQDGKKFMDRIYTINDSDVILFKEYAKENGWYSKFHNASTESGKSSAPDGGIEELDLVVNLSQKYYDYYPYLDTLKYFTPGSGILNNTAGELELEDTGGGHADDCDYCGGSGEVECGDCYGDGEVECSECDGSGEIECDNCDGSGKEECSVCDGSGEIEGETCGNCDGDGDIKCSECHGDCEVGCSDCNGRGNVQCSDCRGSGEVSCYECS